MRVTIRRGAADPHHGPSAKRLQLTGERFAVLASAATAALPPPFADLAASIAVADEAAVWTGLERIGVAERTTTGEFEPVPAVATTLRLLTGAPFAVQLLAGTGEGGVAGWWALDGRRGAGLRLLPDSAVEVSAFLARQWRAEVTRAVTVSEVFETPEAVPTGQVIDPQLAAAIGHPAARLQATAFVRVGDGTASGSVTWAAAPGGWLAIRPDRRSGRVGQPPMVDVVPVQPTDLAVELAPLLVAGATRIVNSESRVGTQHDTGPPPPAAGSVVSLEDRGDDASAPGASET